ncbi:amino acid adenylation domain-containing protein [Streptomyces sp. NPDC020965]|uniref:amino acid adenylation domain-containing protein n=1 Tax=Streptomyces sp. NPDC020965 TaxID=3365105 RepID=UPI00378A77FE
MAVDPLGPPGTLSALVERQAGLVPDAPAVRRGRRWMTYSELDTAATRLARGLVAAGVGPDDVVGVHTGRDFPLVVAVLGVLKAGAAYLALPRDLPAARLAGLTEDAGAVAVVTVEALRAGLPELRCPVVTVDAAGGGADATAEVGPPLPEPDPSRAAYVIYTSGSTGTPKGVVVEHRAAVAHVLAMADRIGTGFGDGVLQMAGESFDVAVEQLFVALSTGAMVVLRGDEPWGPAEVCAELRQGLVTVADLPTALFGELVGAADSWNLPAIFSRVHTVLVGGEAFPAGALNRWRAAFASAGRGPRVINAYGPTEAVMTASTGVFETTTTAVADLEAAGAVSAAPTAAAATAAAATAAAAAVPDTAAGVVAGAAGTATTPAGVVAPDSTASAAAALDTAAGAVAGAAGTATTPAGVVIPDLTAPASTAAAAAVPDTAAGTAAGAAVAATAAALDAMAAGATVASAEAAGAAVAAPAAAAAPAPDTAAGVTAAAPHATASGAGGSTAAGSPGAASVPVGTVVGPRTLRVLDGELTPVRTGEPGELYIGGTALARGYLDRPGLTAERFVPDPFGAPGARMYRTGDRMTEAPDGELTFVGRVDDQLKVRGFRIEPGEVEAVLAGHPAIGQAAVVADGDRLVAHLVSAEAGSRLPATAIREWLGQRLPQWMTPTALAWLDRLPVTASGKVDRSALPTIGADRSSGGKPYERPRDDVQRRLCAVWSRVLNVPEVGIHDDFFALGGTSLLAARALADIRAELAAELPLRALFAAPTPLGLSETLGQTAGTAVLPPVVRGGPADTAPLSLTQRQVWLAEQFSPDSSAYNAPTTLRLHGPLDLTLLERALSEIVRDHEILRTTVELRAGEPTQVVHEPYPVRVPVVDLRAETDPEAAAAEFIRADIGVRFDIGRLPLIRWTALRLAEQTYELVLVEHHLVHDGWSFALLMSELSRIYTTLAEGGEPATAEPAVRYQDFARWQREVLAGPAMRAQLDFWKDRLDGAPQLLELPYDGQRTERDDTTGAVHRMELPAELCERLRAFSADSGVTLFITMLAGYAALLHHYSGQDEVCVGSAFGNRGVPGTADVIGMFVNPVVLRCSVRSPAGPAPSFADLVERTRQVVLDAQANQELPFVELIRELDPPRSPGRNPVFQAMLNFDDSPLSELSLGPVAGSYLERNNNTAKVDLSVLVVPRAERQLGVDRAERDRRITLIWEYRSDLFAAETVGRLADAYTELLAAAVAGPAGPIAELPAGRPLPPARREPAMGAPATVPELLAGVVAAHPTATAVSVPSGDRLDYRELDLGSNQVAHALAARGVGRGDVVALHLPRSVELVVAMVGVLKAGAAYLPLDVTGPAARTADVLADARPQLVLTASAAGAGFGLPALRLDSPDVAGADTTDPGVRPDPAELAYLIYTSGSTGRPKGVGIPHGALVDKYRAWERTYGLDAEPAAHLQLASVAFDVCTGDVFRALLSGGRLVLCPTETLLEPDRLLALLRDERVAYAEFLPSVLRLLVDHAERTGQSLPPARLFAVGGEAWSGADYLRFRAAAGPGTRILNVYGVTEATVGNTFHQPAGDEPGVLPIGGPLPGVRATVLDAAGRPAAPGVVGELYLGGTGLARGYHADPARTATRFVPDPDPDHPGGRLYATGDLGRHRPDGVIEFLGRRDHQVKVRGFRVEPAEIEQALRDHPAVAEAVVVAEPGADGTRLIGYCAPAPAAPAPTPAEVREWLRERLPGYLIPAALVVLAALPRTVSGKVDRGALPAPSAEAPANGRAHTPPRTPEERAVAAIWQQVLGVERVGPLDDFFDLGGHSLAAVRLIARLRADLDLTLTVRDLITEATVEGVVRRAGRRGADGPAVALTARSRESADPLGFDRFDQEETAG